LKRMTPSAIPSDTAVIKAFAGIPGLLGQAPALIARGRALDRECRSGPLDHPFQVLIRSGRIVDLASAPVLSDFLKHSTTSTKQGVHV